MTIRMLLVALAGAAVAFSAVSAAAEALPQKREVLGWVEYGEFERPCLRFKHRVRFDPPFAAVANHGVPDIRTIVYRGYPVMAMIRLPKHQSGGQANLHQGAVGAGVDLASGRMLGGVWHNRRIDIHACAARSRS